MRRKDEEEDVSSYCITLRKEIREIKKGSSRLHSMENLFWKSLRTCLKTDYAMNEWINEGMNK